MMNRVLLHHPLDAQNERARQFDEELRQEWEALEQDKRYRFCKFLISTGRLSDHPIAPVFFRVTRQSKDG